LARLGVEIKLPYVARVLQNLQLVKKRAVDGGELRIDDLALRDKPRRSHDLVKRQCLFRPHRFERLVLLGLGLPREPEP
jgi:hypothetical protein